MTPPVGHFEPSRRALIGGQIRKAISFQIINRFKHFEIRLNRLYDPAWKKGRRQAQCWKFLVERNGRAGLDLRGLR
jgi:hypothetical protein